MKIEILYIHESIGKSFRNHYFDTFTADQDLYIEDDNTSFRIKML